MISHTSASSLMSSPSSRRAWIEICNSGANAGRDVVALLAEGVDRNYAMLYTGLYFARSPSSRRAWIEMSPGQSLTRWQPGRPPRGGRG